MMIHDSGLLLGPRCINQSINQNLCKQMQKHCSHRTLGNMGRYYMPGNDGAKR